MSKIPVLEIFGPTIQGEGMVVGQKTMFIRTAGCDYSCAWCDSAFIHIWIHLGCILGADLGAILGVVTFRHST